MATTCPRCGRKIPATCVQNTLCPNCEGWQRSSQQLPATSSSASAPPRSGASLVALQSALSEARRVREECYRQGKLEAAKTADEIIEMLQQVIWQEQAMQTQREALEPHPLPQNVRSNRTEDWQWGGQVRIRCADGSTEMIMIGQGSAKGGQQQDYSQQLPSPRSNFSLLITPLPSFEHGIGGRSYSQICSKHGESESPHNWSVLSAELSSLRASEKWRLGQGEP